jgi:hypothetical protein
MTGISLDTSKRSAPRGGAIENSGTVGRIIMSEQVGKELQKLIEDIENHKARLRKLSADAEDLQAQVEHSKGELARRRKEFEKCNRGN